MTDLPIGTVTFLFTDIEGSTRLLQALGDRLSRRSSTSTPAIVRRAVADGGGVEVSTEGDALLRRVPDGPAAAVRAAVAAQRALAAHALARRPRRSGCGWALHTGEGDAGRATTTSASTCTARPGSPPRPTAGRCCCPTPPAELVARRAARRRRAARPGRAPAQGPGAPERLYQLVVDRACRPSSRRCGRSTRGRTTCRRSSRRSSGARTEVAEVASGCCGRTRAC